MNIQLINPKPDDIIVLHISQEDAVADAMQTYNTLLTMFPEHNIVINFLSNDLEVKENTES